MTTEALVFEQLLEIIRHTDKIKLDDSIFDVYSSWVDIPKDHSFLMDV